MKKSIYAILLFFVLGIFVLVSCSDGAEKTKEQDKSETVSGKTSGGESPSDSTSKENPKESEERKEVEPQASEGLTPQLSSRLIDYFMLKYGARIPEGTDVKIKGFESVSLKGFEKGMYQVTIPERETLEIPFLITKDRRYIVIGVEDGTNLSEFKESLVPGYKQGEISFGNNRLPALVSEDGTQMLVGNLLDITQDPFKKVMDQISLENVPVKGSEDAEVVIVEYSDFQCPFCKRASAMIPSLLKEYEGKVKIYFKQFPLPMHDWAKDASIASLCAYKQGNDKFWAFHDSLFFRQGRISSYNARETFAQIAENIGLDLEKFKKCLETKKTKDVVEAQFNEGQQLGINSTPTFVVDGMIVPGADLGALKRAIDFRLKSEKK